MSSNETQLDQAILLFKFAIANFGVTPHMVSPGVAQTPRIPLVMPLPRSTHTLKYHSALSHWLVNTIYNYWYWIDNYTDSKHWSSLNQILDWSPTVIFQLKNHKGKMVSSCNSERISGFQTVTHFLVTWLAHLHNHLCIKQVWKRQLLQMSIIYVTQQIL